MFIKDALNKSFSFLLQQYFDSIIFLSYFKNLELLIGVCLAYEAEHKYTDLFSDCFSVYLGCM